MDEFSYIGRNKGKKHTKRGGKKEQRYEIMDNVNCQHP